MAFPAKPLTVQYTTVTPGLIRGLAVLLVTAQWREEQAKARIKSGPTKWVINVQVDVRKILSREGDRSVTAKVVT